MGEGILTRPWGFDGPATGAAVGFVRRGLGAGWVGAGGLGEGRHTASFCFGVVGAGEVAMGVGIGMGGDSAFCAASNRSSSTSWSSIKFRLSQYLFHT